MDLTPIDFRESPHTGMPGTDVAPSSGGTRAGALAARWTAIHEAAEGITFLAGISPETERPEVRHFPEAMRRCGGWRHNLAVQGVEDLIAILEPGVTALLAVHDSGADAKAAAMALWQEFLSARDALIALAPAAAQDCDA